ncbi:MAG: homoserine dehydrogenase [Selenomonadaceae bacterium]|nr:homoserine dehydrogenase [Selenomonadaceae bacterium]MBQ1913684.1 homoserine dehydrogenase [Selenomonadaceae bacterium]MBQ3972317.1 homoserine dehydrogenase [Selenomonadaceae bacterium]
MKKPIKFGLLGSGTVGTGVIRVLQENAREIEERIGAPLELKKVLVRDLGKKRPQLEGIAVTDNIEEIIGDEEISIIVEVMGGIHPAREYMLKAMEAGKSVVTANKDVVAQFGKDMFERAEKQDVDFLFEASVGGGIPIITPLKQCLTANKLTEVMGIVNGTTNYMLTKMAECGADYESVLKEAQEKGYAEANPSADVDGLDAARKAAILASLAFNTRIQLEDVSVEGITKITPMDIEYASELGYVVKLLAVGKDAGEKGVDVRVHPVFLPKEHPLASVRGVFNAIFVRGNAIGEAMFYGPGAGSLPTASAVVSDVIDVARDIVNGTFGRIRCTCFEKKKLCPLDDTESSYYVRLLVDDKPGVLGTIATVFGNEGVSLKSVVQTKQSIADHAEIVAITHMVEHRKMLCAIKVLEGLPVVDEIRSMIRVENDRG